MTSANRRIGLLGAPIVLAILMLAAGCQHTDDAVASTSTGGEARPIGVTKEASIKAVEDNPHIPAQAKANIIRQLKGEAPTSPPASTK